MAANAVGPTALERQPLKLRPLAKAAMDVYESSQPTKTLSSTQHRENRDILGWASGCAGVAEITSHQHICRVSIMLVIDLLLNSFWLIIDLP